MTSSGPEQAKAVLFVKTGETRQPHIGEWFLDSDGRERAAAFDFFLAYPILRRIEISPDRLPAVLAAVENAKS